MQLAGTVAVVTGGASGLGLATVRRLGAAGARVVAVDLPSDEGAARVEEAGATFAPADITDEVGVAGAFDVAAGLGEPRVLVNCAGIVSAGRVVGRHGPLELSDFARAIGVNLIGTFNVCRLAAARMTALDPVDGERGVIVNTASIAAFDGQVGQAAYAASKGGVASMTLPLARDLAPHAVRVMTVAPGTFLTPMLAALPRESRDSLAAQVPHPQRMGDPDEYAMLVEHVVSNPMLNGEVIRIDGALRMAPR